MMHPLAEQWIQNAWNFCQRAAAERPVLLTLHPEFKDEAAFRSKMLENWGSEELLVAAVQKSGLEVGWGPWSDTYDRWNPRTVFIDRLLYAFHVEKDDLRRPECDARLRQWRDQAGLTISDLDAYEVAELTVEVLGLHPREI